MKQTTIYISEEIREEINKRIEELKKEIGISHLSLNGYILKLINDDIKK